MQFVNEVRIHGLVRKEPVLRETTAGTPVLNFMVETQKKRKDSDTPSTPWHRCVVWGERASMLSGLLKDGTPVAVLGELAQRSYESEGQKKWTTEVNAYVVAVLPEEA